MKTLLTAVLLAGVSTSAMADTTDTRDGFLNAYKRAVDIGISKGATSKETCDDAKCLHTMVFRDNKYWTVLHRFEFFSGTETVALCFMPLNDSNNSHCKSSDGGMWDEHFDGADWKTTTTYRTSWNDSAS